MANPPDLAFAVPRGFEDVACKDILRFVSPRSTHFQLDTGYVHLKTDDISTFSSVLDAYDAGRLWSVTRCLICLHEQSLVLSKDLELRLAAERKSLPSKRSRARTAAGARAGNTSESTVDTSSVQSGPTESENVYLTLLQENIRSSKAQFARAFEVWKGATKYEKIEQGLPVSFAVRLDRRDFLFPTLKSLDIERSLGSAFYDRLEDHVHRDNIRVRLENPDLEVTW